MQMIMMQSQNSEQDSEEKHNLRLQVFCANEEITNLIKKMEDYEKSEVCKRFLMSELIIIIIVGRYSYLFLNSH